MLVSGIVKTSLVDYPGKISCVLFSPGCNFNCFYCHNRSLIEGRQAPLPEEEIFKFLEERKNFTEGVVISGGEATLQKGLSDFTKRIRNMGFKTKLDTNGSCPGLISQFIKEGLFDYYAVDYKTPKSMYKDICGENASASEVIETIYLLLESGVLFEARTTVIPQLDEEALNEMASDIPKLPKYVLNRYVKPKEYPEDKISMVNQNPYSDIQIKCFAEKMSVYQPNIKFI